jgi:hypothetical protein
MSPFRGGQTFSITRLCEINCVIRQPYSLSTLSRDKKVHPETQHPVICIDRVMFKLCKHKLDRLEKGTYTAFEVEGTQYPLHTNLA